MRAVIIGALSRENGSTGKAIADILAEAGVEAWFVEDVFDEAGVSWRAIVERAIQRADLVIADFSAAGPNVTYEVGLARGLGKPLLPIVRAEEEDSPLVVDGVWYFVYDDSNFGKLCDHVRAWVHRHVGVTEGVASVA